MSAGRADNWLFLKESPLYQQKQRVSQSAARYTQKRKQNSIHTHTHTHIHNVRMFGCVLTAGVHARKSEQTKNRYVHAHQWNINPTVFSPKEMERDQHACMHMHACMHVPSAAQPHLKGVRVCTTWASVCVDTILLIHPLRLSVCLSVCTCTSVCPDACVYNAEVLCMCNKYLMLGQTAVIYTHTYTHLYTYTL
jgi:hypothetical protein